MTLRTRLIRIADGKVVYDATLRYEDGTYHEFDVWAANEAQLFKEEFGPCYPALAEKIVEEVFLLYLPSQPEPHRQDGFLEGHASATNLGGTKLHDRQLPHT